MENIIDTEIACKPQQCVQEGVDFGAFMVQTISFSVRVGLTHCFYGTRFIEKLCYCRKICCYFHVVEIMMELRDKGTIALKKTEPHMVCLIILDRIKLHLKFASFSSFCQNSKYLDMQAVIYLKKMFLKKFN